MCNWHTGEEAIVCVYHGGAVDCSSTQYLVELCYDSGDFVESPPVPWGMVEDFSNNADVNGNGRIDKWQEVLDTDDPCGYQFDNNDKLGTNHGGQNTVRPGHAGVDIQADYFDPVGSMEAGLVEGVWQNAGACGKGIQVVHANGSRAKYCHLASTSNTQQGDWVLAGEIIGYADSTGNSTGHHLHLVYWNPNGSLGSFYNHVDTSPTQAEKNGSC